MVTQRIEYEAQLTKCFKTMLPNGKKNTKYHLKKLPKKLQFHFHILMYNKNVYNPTNLGLHQP